MDITDENEEYERAKNWSLRNTKWTYYVWMWTGAICRDKLLSVRIKCFFKVNINPITWFLSSRALYIYAKTSINAWLDEWFVLNPEWYLYKMFCFSNNDFRLLYMSFSRSLWKTFKSAWSWSVIYSRKLIILFWTGITFAVFSISGKVPSLIELLRIITSPAIIWVLTILIMFLLRISIIGFLAFNFSSFFSISPSGIGFIHWVSPKKFTKLTKRSFKLITSVNNM